MINMLFSGDKNKTVFDKINSYLEKKGHSLLASVFLSNYNGNNIYVRFDYVDKLSVYKIVWVDLNFFEEKHIEDYINMQLVTKFLSLRIVEHLSKLKLKEVNGCNEDIIGDRVEILNYINGKTEEYIFDRFLPLEWPELIDILAMIFTYLPRSMEVFLNEIFGKFDGTEERYNSTKPVKFDLFSGDPSKLFKPVNLQNGVLLHEKGQVSFLEKIDDKYLAVVEDRGLNLVFFHPVSDEHVLMGCSCKGKYFCKHIYAALLALRNEEFKPFYKVKYIGRQESLLEQVTLGSFYLCFGVDGNKILLVTSDGFICPADIIQKGKCVFEVIEDDDDCSLSKLLNEYKEK